MRLEAIGGPADGMFFAIDRGRTILVIPIMDDHIGRMCAHGDEVLPTAVMRYEIRASPYGLAPRLLYVNDGEHAEAKERYAEYRLMEIHRREHNGQQHERWLNEQVSRLHRELVDPIFTYPNLRNLLEYPPGMQRRLDGSWPAFCEGQFTRLAKTILAIQGVTPLSVEEGHESVTVELADGVFAVNKAQSEKQFEDELLRLLGNLV